MPIFSESETFAAYSAPEHRGVLDINDQEMRGRLSPGYLTQKSTLCEHVYAIGNTQIHKVLFYSTSRNTRGVNLCSALDDPRLHRAWKTP